ncbi:hypothetical protein ABZ897_31170 [Nonomuraea sp. NPDC046802]|uniref:hypothetical protein n=1 Tax=Nonomuraea sp. NPDC046802 TaxID=3154919 RepID=UPI0033EE0A0D
MERGAGGKSGWGDAVMAILAVAWPVATYGLFGHAVVASYAGDQDRFMAFLTAAGLVMTVIPAAISVIARVTQRRTLAGIFGALTVLSAFLAVVVITGQ